MVTYVVPTAPGQAKLFFGLTKPASGAALPMRLALRLFNQPWLRWWGHFAQNNVLDGDNVFLHMQAGHPCCPSCHMRGVSFVAECVGACLMYILATHDAMECTLCQVCPGAQSFSELSIAAWPCHLLQSALQYLQAGFATPHPMLLWA